MRCEQRWPMGGQCEKSAGHDGPHERTVPIWHGWEQEPAGHRIEEWTEEDEHQFIAKQASRFD